MASFDALLVVFFCDLELQESKQETRYRPGKSKAAGSPTLATWPHFKPRLRLERWKRRGVGNVWHDVFLRSQLERLGSVVSVKNEFDSFCGCQKAEVSNDFADF